MNTFFVQDLFGNTSLADILTIQYNLARHVHIPINEQNNMPISEFQFMWEMLLEENEKMEQELNNSGP